MTRRLSVCAVLLAFFGLASTVPAREEVEAVPIPVPKPVRRFGFGDLRQVAVAPDLRWVATGGKSGAVLWSMDDPTSAHRLEVPWSATALEFSPDSRDLYVASQNQILVLDPVTRATRRTLQGHTREVTRLRFTDDGAILASASVDNSVRLWSTTSGEELLSVRTPGSAVDDVAFSPDGATIATVDGFLTNNVRFWDRATGAFLRSLPTTNASIHRCLFTPAGAVVTVSADRTLSLWNAALTATVRTFTGVTNPSTIVLDAWFPNDSTLAAVASDGRVRLWNLDSGDLLKVTDGDLAIAGQGVRGEHLVATGDLDSNVHLRQLPGGDSLRVFRGHTTSTHAGVAFSPDGRYVLSGGVERSLRLWDRTTGGSVREFEVSPAGTMAVGFSSDGTQVYGTLGLPQPGVRLWRTATGEVVRDFRWSTSWPISATLSADSARLAAGAQDQRVRLFDVRTGNLLREFRTAGWPSRLAFAPTVPWLAIGTTEGKVTVVDAESGEVLKELEANAGSITVLQFSGASRTLLVGWQDGLIRLYDAPHFEMRQELVGRSGFLDTGVLSPDGSTLVLGESFPGFTVTVYDVPTGKILRTLGGYRWSPTAMAMTPDGGSLLVGADGVTEWSIVDLAPRIAITRAAGGVQISWNRGVLERAGSAAGPWELVPDATSPWSKDTVEDLGLYRIAPPTR